MTALPYEEEIKITKTREQKDSIITRLKEKGLLRYGSVITEDNIEYIMQLQKNDLSIEEWQFTNLQLREIIKNEGYFVTSRGRQGDLYILEAHEMGSFNEQKNKNMLKALKQRQRALHMIDESLLSDEHKKKLEFEILRNASFEIEMAKRMKERCRY